MIKLSEHVDFISGTPQFRIKKVDDCQAPEYQIYSQSDLFEDLTSVSAEASDNKTFRTYDQVRLLSGGDIVFSLISGNACIVSDKHEGYLCTQNYIKLIAKQEMDPEFLVYTLNENSSIRRQLQTGLQGTTILKYTLKQLKELMMPDLPLIEKQRIIGKMYLKQLRVEALKCRVAKAETLLMFCKLKEVVGDERESI